MCFDVRGIYMDFNKICWNIVLQHDLILKKKNPKRIVDWKFLSKMYLAEPLWNDILNKKQIPCNTTDILNLIRAFAKLLFSCRPFSHVSNFIL